MEWWEKLMGVLAGLAGMYVILLLGLWVYARRHPETVGMKDALRLLPDLLRVLQRLTADRTVPRGVRVKLSLLLAYLLLPFDLVPDFLPVIGYADDVVIVALVLRSVIRSAGPEPLRRHWPGTPAGLKGRFLTNVATLTESGVDSCAVRRADRGKWALRAWLR